MPSARRAETQGLNWTLALRLILHHMVVFSGRTLDLSDRGLSATAPVELPVGEVVQLNFTLQLGRVAVFATVRNKNGYRHGFQFVEPNPAQHLIRENCCLLERIIPDAKNRCN